MPINPLVRIVNIFVDVPIVSSALFILVEVPIMTLPPASTLKIGLDEAIVKRVLDAGLVDVPIPIWPIEFTVKRFPVPVDELIVSKFAD